MAAEGRFRSRLSEGAKSIELPRFSATIVRNVDVPMRDGTILRADIWLPSPAGRHPVLLMRLPYDKSIGGIIASAGPEPLRAVERGYAVVVQDTRGTFASDGVFRAFELEAQDGYDSVQWCAAQSWSNGRVGMFGPSYVGATQLLAASQRPPALKAIAPFITASDYYEGWIYQGGAFQLGFAFLWGCELAMISLAQRARLGYDVSADVATVEDLFRNIWREYRVLPLKSSRLAKVLPSYRDWLDHPERDEFWKSIIPRPVEVPALNVAGWHDIFLGGSLRNFHEVGSNIIVGPWAHGGESDVVGEGEFGPSAAVAALDLGRVQLDFFDGFLPDTAPGRYDGPRVRRFLMGTNVWVEEETWPPADAEPLDLYLRAGGRLLRQAPAREAEDEFTYNPHDPVPTTGGQTFLPGLATTRFSGWHDEASVESRRDVLVYTSEPLDTDTEIAGPVTVTLYAASSAPDTDFTAKLCKVGVDGRSLGLADGIIRTRYAGGSSLYEIDCAATSLVVTRGERLRVQISSSNFPRFDRNPNHGGTIADATEKDLRSARQTVFHDRQRPSALHLSVRR